MDWKIADNLAEDVHQRLYEEEPLQTAEGEEPEEPEHPILSENSEDSDFDGFEPNHLLS